MRSNVQYRNEAIRLRKQGKSYSEIMTKVPVAKSTLSKWFQYLPLTKKEEKFLKERMLVLQDNGRLKVAIANKVRNEKRRDLVRVKAKVDFEKYKDDPFFVLGLSLYWAEGAKRNNYFSFMNSDADMVRIMMRWVSTFLKVDPVDFRFRLYIHESYAEEQWEKFWSRSCAIPRSQFQKTIYTSALYTVKKNPQYKGCLRMITSGVDHLIIVTTWQKLLSAYYSEA